MTSAPWPTVQSLELAGLTLRVDERAGHTAGSVVFGTADGGPDGAPVLFTGDLLFAGSIGRMDMPGGSEADMVASLNRVVLPRPDQTVVHAGHGGSTTIGRERRTNPYLQNVDWAPAGSALVHGGIRIVAERIRPLSGFPELLPAQRIVEQQILDQLRATFELHGFASIETRAAEPLDQLLRKGEIEKEVYLLRRLQADSGRRRSTRRSTLGLHFDLTVPFARYVLENAGKLDFPFRRYQIQKAWRGERPQEGRYREFTQADIDVVGRDVLPFHHDVEVARVMAEALSALPIPPLRMQVNNRRLMEGFFRGVGAAGPARGDAHDRQDGQGAAGADRRAAGDRRRTERGAGVEVPGAGRDPQRGHVVRRLRSARSASPTSCSTRVWPSWPRSWTGPAASRPGASRSRPICVSPAGWTTTPAPCSRPGCRATSRSARSAPAAVTTRWPATDERPTRAWASPSA